MGILEPPSYVLQNVNCSVGLRNFIANFSTNPEGNQDAAD
jgi:hypothetical protein